MRGTSNNVRVLHVVGSSQYGGGVQVILPLAVMALRQGWDVDILTTDPTFQSVTREAGVGVVDLDVIHREIRPWRDLMDVYRLARYLAKHPYTIVHTHTSKGGLVGRLAAKLARVPVIVHTVHGFAFHEASSRLARTIYSTIERIAAHWCHHLVTVSNFHRSWACDMKICAAKKITAVPNGIPPERVAPTCSRDEARRSLGLGENEFAIVATGRLAPQKGFEYLLQAVPMLRARLRRPFRILIAGAGPSREELEQLSRTLGVGAEVTFLGFRHDIGNLQAAADLIALPSLWEGLSIALLEAMAARKPIVTTRIGSNLEVAAGGEIAALVDAGSAKQLADAIVRCAHNTVYAGTIATTAREVFEQRYTQQMMLDGYLNIYHELMEALEAAPESLPVRA